MRHISIPGGWYTHSLPSGEYASLVAGGIATHFGKIAQPVNDAGKPDGPLFIDITMVGGLHIAGKGADSYITHERMPDGTWVRHPDACGNYSVIYDLNGVLHISDCSIGSQGWRFVALDGTLVTGDQTTGHPVGLWEWTDLGGILVGQGDYGVRVYADGKLRQLSVRDEQGIWHQVGDKTFDIKARRVGDNFSLSFYDVAPDGLTAHIFLGTIDELVAQPPVAAAPPPPPPPTQPKPEPEPTPVSTPNHLEVVQAVNAAFPHLLETNTNESCGQFTERVALALRDVDPDFGLVSKSGAEKQYRGHGIDSLKHRNGQVIDIIGAAGAKTDGENRVGTPVWSEVPSRDGNNWMAPMAVEGETLPPAPGPTNSGPTTIDAMVRSLIAAAIGIESSERAKLSAEVLKLTAEIAELKARPIAGNTSLTGKRIGLRTENGHVLCAEGGGGGEVHSRRDAVNGWETFIIEEQA